MHYLAKISRLIESAVFSSNIRINPTDRSEIIHCDVLDVNIDCERDAGFAWWFTGQ